MYDYEVIRSRRRTIAIEVDRQGRVVVRAPYNVGNLKIKLFVAEKTDWIERALKKVEERGIISTDSPFVYSEADIRTLMEEAKTVIPGRVALYAKKIGVTYGRITIRHQKSRWGSCSTKGNLNFNCMLMHAPEEILDYVIIHELCHRKHMNHSPEFWAEVEKICPDYKKRRKWLGDNGAIL